jgi:hypothetical protein
VHHHADKNSAVVVVVVALLPVSFQEGAFSLFFVPVKTLEWTLPFLPMSLP